MVVCKTSCLHEGVNNRWTHATEASAYKILAYKLSFRCLHGDLSLIPELALCRLVAHKVPHVLLKRSILSYNLDETRSWQRYKLCKIDQKRFEVYITLRTWRELSRIDLSLTSESKEMAEITFFSFSSETATGSKSMKTSLRSELVLNSSFWLDIRSKKLMFWLPE